MNKERERGKRMLRYASIFSGSSLETHTTYIIRKKLMFWKLVIYAILTISTLRTVSQPWNFCGSWLIPPVSTGLCTNLTMTVCKNRYLCSRVNVPSNLGKLENRDLTHFDIPLSLNELNERIQEKKSEDNIS